MELYSFLRKNEKHQRNNWNVSVSLRSYIHSYLKDVDVITELMLKPFPSPYGVIFILTLCYDAIDKKFITHEFPSPYGVSFILILNVIILI